MKSKRYSRRLTGLRVQFFNLPGPASVEGAQLPRFLCGTDCFTHSFETMKKQHFFAAILVALASYSANAQSSSSTTTTRQTTVTPATPASPSMAPAPMTPASTTTTESTTSTMDKAPATVVQTAPAQAMPANAKVKDKRNKTKIKPKH